MRTDRIAAELFELAQTIFGLSSAELDPDAGILELGLDSLMIIKLGQEIERCFGVSLEASWFLSTMPSLSSLAGHINDRLPEDAAATARPTPSRGASVQPGPGLPARPDETCDPVAATPVRPISPIRGEAADTGLSLCVEQLRAMQDLFAAQLAAFSAPCAPHAAPSEPATPHAAASAEKRPHARGFVLSETPLTEEQAAFVARLVRSHLEKTPTSRELGRRTPILADWKSTFAYRVELKETAYPIVADVMRGSRFTDVDGNEYLDIAVGMGVHYLGSSPPYVEDAVRRRLERGFALGPQCDLTAKAAEGVSRLTSMERVSFCNTGSETIMFALRLARARSGKDLVVLFSGAYHGVNDGILCVRENGRSTPSSIGIPQGMADDVLLLDYNKESAFEQLEAVRHRLAAVLVEPVQSRRPGLQPQSFLRRLRRFTRQHGICLIFDEMVTGFRCAPGGAQEYFGVRADMALYGKVLGGGVPVGVLTGSKEYLDYIDGGFLGRDSQLSSEQTIAFGGTFCRHPFAMEAVAAVTDHLLEHGKELCDRTARLAGLLADSLNLWFQDHEVPLRVMHFGPQFIFESYGRYSAFAQPIELQLFYLILLQHGVYTWERRTCGLSTCHTEEEVERIIQAVKDSVSALRQGGFAFRVQSGAPLFFAPMTPTQERLFAVFQRDHGQDAYHLPLGWRLRGSIDQDFAERLEIALGSIIVRHEALRTAFVQLEGRLLRKILTEPPFFLERTSRAQNAGLSAEEQIRRFLRPFDLAAAPLLRALLAEQEDGSFLFLLDVLHIAADGVSLGLIINELNAFMSDVLPDAPPLSLRQGAAAASLFPDREREDDANYWAERLKEISPPELPYDRPALAGSPEGGQHWMRIEADVVTKARAACKTYGITLNMFLNGAYVLLLQALTGNKVFCVGMADGGRPAEAASVVGMFVNTVPQLFTVNPESGLREFFTGIRLSCAESMRRNHAPYADIVEKLGFSPATTMLSYERADERNLNWPGISATPLAAHGQGAMYDFAVDIVEMDGVLHCNLAHSAAFSEKNAGVFGEVFEQIIRQIAAGTDIPVREINLLPPAHLEVLRKEWQDSVHRPDHDADPFRTVPEAVEARCALCPDRTALVLDHNGLRETLTYGELREKSDHLARRLLSFGLGPESVVAILLPRRPSFVLACLAAMKAGAAYLPLSPDHPAERLGFMLDDAEARAVISTADLLPLLEGYSGPVLDMDADNGTALATGFGTASGAAPATRLPGERDLAYIIYTSGTTGLPKGVMVEQHSLYNLCRFFIRHFGVTAEDRCAAFAPFIFDASIWEIFPLLMQGASVHILHEDTRLDLPRLHDYLRKHRITLSYYLAQVAEMIEGDTLPDLRLLLSGGDVIRLRRPRGAYRHNNSYGPTEFTVTSHAYDLDGTWPVPLGYPVDNTQSIILDVHGRVMPLGFPGELHLAGSQIARGYLKRPDLTAQKFKPNPLLREAPAGTGVDYSLMYATGDLCRRSAEGPYIFMGRMDSQVKIRGHRVETGEVEAVLLHHPDVAQAVVRALSEEDGRKFLCAYITPAPGVSPKELEAALTSAVARSLPPYMAPRNYVFVQAIPYRANGKVHIEALPRPKDRESAFEEPRSGLETLLAGIWQAHLHKKKIGRNDNFFDLGGDSIKALMLTAGARSAGYSLASSDIFQAPLLREQALRLKPLRAARQAAAPQKTASGAQTAVAFPATEAAEETGGIAPSIMPDARPAAASGALHLPAAAPLDREDEKALRARYGAFVEHILVPSAMQMGMVFHQRLASDPDMYVEQTLLRIRPAGSAQAGPDPEVLRARFRALIARHESLRSVIAEKGLSRPALLVLSPDAVPRQAFTCIDLSTQSEADRRRRLEQEAIAERAALADLSQPPLARIRLYACREGEYRLLFTVHHAFFDGWSSEVFFGELLQDPLSHDRKAGSDPLDMVPEALRQAAPPFRSCLEWRRGQDREAARAWWRARLKGVEERTVLPGLSPCPEKGKKDARLPLPLPERTLQRLRRMAGETCITLNTVLQAAWAMLLSRANRHEDIIFGEVVSGRPPELEGMEKIIGPCVNTIPVRARCAKGQTFRELARAMHANALAAQEAHWLPLPEIQAQSPLRSELFSHFFVMENYPAPYSPQGLDISLLDGFSRTSFDFALVWEEDARSVAPSFHGSFIFNAHALPAWQAEVLCKAYVTLLEAVAADPDADVSSYALLSPEARQAQLRAFAPAKAELPHTDAAALFSARAAAQPEATALVFGRERMSYAELEERSLQLAARLADICQGASEEKTVAVFLERGLGFAVALLAVMKAGMTFVPLDAQTPPERLTHCLLDAAVCAVIGQASLRGRIPGQLTRLPFLDIDDSALYAAPAAFRAVANPAERTAYIIYTSGTTGRPKGVMIAHRGLLNQVIWSMEHYALLPGQRLTHFAAHAFDVSLWELLPPLAAGAEVHILNDELRHDPTKLHTYVEKHEIRHLWLPPQMAALYVQEFPTGCLRSLTAGGDNFMPGDVRAADEDFVLYNNYGPTECTITSASCRFRPGERPTLGRPVLNTPCYVLDQYGHLQPPGFAGELFIGGPQVGKGYLGQPERSARSFVPDTQAGRGEDGQRRMYASGDLCRYLPDGRLVFLGRLDAQLKIRGYRLEPGEVEKALLRHPLLRQCVVAARAKGPGGEKRLLAWAIPAENSNENEQPEQAILAEAGRWLPAHMLPDALILVDAFPISSSGKVLVDQLPSPPDPALQGARGGREGEETGEANAHHSPPTAPEQQILLETLAGMLTAEARHSPFSLSDNFFRRGGDSIIAMRLAAALGRQGYALAVKDIFQAATLLDVSRRMIRTAVDGTADNAASGDHAATGNAAALSARITQAGRSCSGISSSAQSGQAGFLCPPEDERLIRKRYAKQGVEGIYPLTPMQLGMLFDMRHHAETASAEADPNHTGLYLVANEAKIRGRLDDAQIEELENRLHHMTSRHPALRLVIVEDGLSRPLQAVLRHKPSVFVYEDISHLPESARKDIYRNRLRERRLQGLRLDADPLLQLFLFRLAPDAHHAILVWHHIVLDGWSLSLLMRELFAPEAELGPAPDIGRYLCALAGEDMAAQRAWWEKVLEGAPETVESTSFPVDSSALPDSEDDTPGLMRTVSVVPDRFLETRLRAFARENGVTVGNVLLTAWALLLARYADREDIVLAVLSSGRNAASRYPGNDADGLIGPCISTLPLRLRCPYHAPFTQLARETQAFLAEAMEHEHSLSGFARELLGPEFGRVLFVMENQPAADPDAPLSITPGASFGRNGLDLAFEWRDAGELRGTLHHAPGRYAGWRMEALAGHFLLLLEDALQQPAAPCGCLALISPAEERRLLTHCNDTDTKQQPGSFTELFLQAASECPDRPALAGAESSCSYRELRDTALYLAAALRAKGVGRGKVAGVLVSRGTDYLLAELGVMLAGAAFVPLAPDWPARRLREILDDCGAAGLIVDSHTAVCAPQDTVAFALDTLREEGTRLYNAASGAVPAYHPDLPGPDLPDSDLPGPDDLAYILYTSGSTGKPKGAMIPHKGLANLCRWFATAHAVNPGDAFSVYAPFIFDASLYEAFPALAAGAAVHVVPEEIRLDEDLLAEFFRKRGISVAFLPPLVGKALLRGRTFPRLRVLTFAGESPGPLAPMPFKLLNAYGPTEFTVCATCWEVTEPCDAPPIGFPIANTRCYVLDSRKRLVPFGVPGELHYAGIQIADGYINLPEKTAESFLPNPFAQNEAHYARMYKSGDRCRRNRDGSLQFLGRMDRQIKLRGQRLEPQEIEEALLRHPEVREAAAILVRKGESGLLQAYVSLMNEGGGKNDPAAPARILHWLSSRLPDWMLPSDLHVLEAMPLTVNGKIDREALPGMVPEAETSTPQAPGANFAGKKSLPASPGETLLRDVWQEILGLTEVDEAASFFALGGDSIKAMLLVSRLRAKGFKLTTRQIFRLQRLDRISQALEELPPATARTGAAVSYDASATPVVTGAPIVTDAAHGPNAPDKVNKAGTPDRQKTPGRPEAADQAFALPATIAPDAADEALIRSSLAARGLDVSDIFALTPMQEALLSSQALHAGSPHYIEQIRLDIHGLLEADALQKALEAAVQRHAMLRTVFFRQGVSRPFQVVLKKGVSLFSFHDLGALSPEAQDAALTNALEEIRTKGLEGENGPPVRFDLYRLAEARSALLVSFHHAALDGWSVRLLLRDILDPQNAVPPASGSKGPDYRAYAEWLAQAQNDAPADRQWWSACLADALPPELGLALPTADAAYENRSLSRTLPLALTRKLHELSAKVGVTLQTIAAAAWGTVLARRGNRNNATLGVVLSGRSAPLPGIEDMVGLLVRTVPLCVSCASGQSIADMLLHTQDTALLAEEHSALPLPDILKCGPFGPDLLPTLFVFENLPEGSAPKDLSISVKGGFNQTPHALSLVADYSMAEEKLRLRLSHDATRLPPALAHDLLTQIETVLSTMAADPLADSATLELLPEADRKGVLLAGLAQGVMPREARAADPRLDVLTLFRQAALRHAHRPALCDGAQTVSYAEADRLSDALAARLRMAGISNGAIVAVLAGRSVHTVTAMLGILKAGAAYLALDPEQPPKRRDFLLRDAGAAALILAPSPLPAPFPDGQSPFLPPEEEEEEEETAYSGLVLHAPECFAPLSETAEAKKPEADASCLTCPLPDEPAYLVYTSGSTGLPKGILVERGALSNFCRWHKAFYEVGPEDVSGHVFSFAFDASAWGIFPLLAAGGLVHILCGEDRVNPARMRDSFDRNGVTLANIPTLFMADFSALPPPQKLRLLACGGDRLRSFGAVPYAAYNEYGPSEATIMCACQRIQDAGQPYPIGRAIASAWCLVLDDDERVQPFGVPGELHVSGPLLARGYLNRPDETRRAFVPNPYASLVGREYARMYKTGDICRMRPDGVLEFLGRKDDQVSIRGHRVEIAEAEQAILDLPHVSSAIVVPRKIREKNFLAAYVTPEDQELRAAAPDDTQARRRIAEWKAALARKLPAYMVPEYWRILPAIPMTANGKVDKDSLPEPDFGTGAGSGEPARSAVQLALADIWQKTLHVPAVGLDDDFFALGGDSLKAVRAAALAGHVFDVSLKVTDFMQNSTLRAFAALVENADPLDAGSGKAAATPLIPLRKGSGTTLVLVPSLGGSLLCYKGLLDALPDTVPVCALAPGALPRPDNPENPDGPDSTPPTVADMAKAYVPHLAAAFPDGNIMLLGLCMAGLTAWETACQLEERNIRIAGVISLNTRSRLLVDEAGRPLHGKVLAAVLAHMPKEAVDMGLETLGKYEGFAHGQPAAAADYIRWQLTAWGGYTPRPCNCSMLCLRPEEAVGDDHLPFETRPLGWDEAALGGVRDIYVPGSHYSMLGAPHAEKTAGIILSVLRDPAFAPAGHTSAPAGHASAPAGHAQSAYNPADWAGQAIPLTPIQCWFFALPMKKEQFFQSVTLHSRVRRPAPHYQRALAALVQRHEMLRAFYVPAREEASPDAAPALPAQYLARDADPVAVVGLHLCEAEKLDQARAAVARNQRLDRPPLAWCLVGQDDAETNGADVIVLMFHHLIVDSVSWRILLQDFSAALQCLERGEPVALPSEPLRDAGSFADWSRALTAYAAGLEPAEAMRDQRDPPDALRDPAADPPPEDRRASRASGKSAGRGRGKEANRTSSKRINNVRRLKKDLRSSSIILDAALSAAILTRGRFRYDAGADAILLAAFMEALHEHCGRDTFTVLIEGHGREELFADISPFAVVGWFTSLYPLPLRREETYAATAARIARCLEETPLHGLGYGIARYLRGKKMPDTGKADLTFNFLGEMEAPGGNQDEAAPFTLQSLGSVWDAGDDFPQETPLECSAHIQEKRLHITVSWHPRETRDADMRLLLDRMRFCLERAFHEQDEQ